jgi:hypothetical protein
MQLARQSKPKAASSRRTPKVIRGETMRAIHATWRKICDLEGDDLRAARLAFSERVLDLRKPLKSMTKLTPAQLGRVLDAMRERERAPGLFGVSTSEFRVAEPGTRNPEPETGEVFHLATSAQVEAIDKLFAYLGWSTGGFEKFLDEKFQRRSARMLTPAQANACTMILFTIAGRKRVLSGMQYLDGDAPKISRALIRAEIPRLKRELGIDQQRSGVRGRRSDDESEY